MNIERDSEYLQRHLSLHLHGLLPPSLCGEMIARYDDARPAGQSEAVKNELVDACRERVFTDGMHALLEHYFQGPFEVLWPSLDVVDGAGYPRNLNAAWHLDGGTWGMHKLFIYLNAVAEHGGNTVMMDLERTRQLRRAAALPLELDKRKEDVSGVFEALGISPDVLAYDLKAGDGLLFDPTRLAHRCQPTVAGKHRYTICFCVVPQRFMRRQPVRT